MHALELFFATLALITAIVITVFAFLMAFHKRTRHVVYYIAFALRTYWKIVKHEYKQELKNRKK